MTDTEITPTESQSWDPRNRLWAHSSQDVTASALLYNWLVGVAPTPSGARDRQADIGEEWAEFIDERGEKVGLHEATNRLWEALQEWALVHPTRRQAVSQAEIAYDGEYVIVTLDWQTLYYEVRNLYEAELHNRQ